MKYTILAVSAAVLCMGSAYGAAINATNLAAGTGDTIVTDNAGNAVSGLWSGLTTFGGGGAPSDIAGLIASAPSILGSSDIVGVADGAFSNSYNGPDGTGEAIYLILANNADLAAATLFGLINTGQTLDPDGATPDSNNYILSGAVGTAIIGGFNDDSVSADWTNLVGGPIDGPQFQLELVPEPSTSLLAGLAAFGLLLRRRR